MTIDEINTIRLALDTPEHNRHYVKHVTDAKMILNKEQEAINYTRCCKSDSEQLFLFSDWLQYNGKWSTTEQQVKDFLKEQSK